MSARPRLKFLDGLRGWGAVIVVLYHVCSDGLPVDPATATQLLYLPIFNGIFAVLVFFVVSGFSLSVRYLADGDLRSWVQIAAGRYFRLAIPVFCACLLVHLAMRFGHIDPAEQRLAPFREMLNFQPTFGHLLNFSLIDVFANYRRAESYIGPLWTMSIELAGSIFVLVLILAAGRSPLRAIAFIGFSAGTILIASSPNVAMLALFPLGAAMADAFNRGWLQQIPAVAGIVLLLGGCALPSFIPFNAFAWGTGAAAVVCGCIVWPQARSFMGNWLSVELGKISFPLYLIHGPVMWLIGEPLMRRFGSSVEAILAVQALTIVASFGAAVLFLPVNTFAIRLSRAFGTWAGQSIALKRHGTS